MAVVSNNWRTLLMFIHHIRFILSFKVYRAKSCVQIILNCDEENMFLMNRFFSVVMYWVAWLSAFDLEPALVELLHKDFSESLVNV